jgi:molybdate transport system substrate-binding protein
VNRRLVVCAALTLLAATACSSSSDSTPTSATTSASGGGTLTVFAAASLKNTFTALGTQFEAAHPGVKVTFNFAGSSDLATQIQQGAPADVFASADTKNMDKVTAEKLIAGTPVLFASNTLEIAVPPGNPAKITGLKDLTNPAVKLSCAPRQSRADRPQTRSKPRPG